MASVPPQESAPWRLTLDAVARFPRPGSNSPSALAFSPDGRVLTYLFSEAGDLSRQLWAVDLDTGTRRVLARAPEDDSSARVESTEEALRRERLRLREGGITQYTWAKSAERVLIPHRGRLLLTSAAGGALTPLPLGDEPVSDARLTPDGDRVVFVRSGDLWSADVASGATKRLTDDATDGVFNGLAEYIAQEEMGRAEGFWVSPDGALVAFARVDETHIPAYPIVHQGTETWTVEQHRYPFAGGPNAAVRLGVVPTTGGPVRWLGLGAAPDQYVARVDWCPDGRLAVQIQTRDQRRLQLWGYDTSTGDRALLVDEQSEVWINLHKDLRFVGTDGSFIWSSESSGFRHLSLHGPDGARQGTLTSGAWAVDGVVHVDEEAGWVYFLAARETPLERHLYRVRLKGGEVERLTDEPGYHGAVFASQGGWYAHTFESRSHPPVVDVRSTRSEERIAVSAEGRLFGPSPNVGGRVAVRAVQVIPDLEPPEIVSIRASDGETLYGAIYRPPGATTGPFPLVVAVYGGPHVQAVADTWGLTVDLRAQYLASQGFLVFKLDNRGSARRGLAFEGAIQRHMGTVEVSDQVEGVEWLVRQGLADPRRVGIYGWSYGGYMTLMCLVKAPEVFRVGVAGAPVTDWDGYDTHYTERYMDTPASNREGYAEASALTHAGGLRGKLLLVHGMVDENVHFRHTARLLSALAVAGRPHDLVVFPAERHMPRDEAGRRYLEERVVDYFVRHLAPEGPDGS